MRDALMLELHREHADELGKKHKNFKLIVSKVVEMARDGKQPAIDLIFDRVDGKLPVPQQQPPMNLAISFVLQNGPQLVDITPSPMQITGIDE